jgi:hypothetical protein
MRTYAQAVAYSEGQKAHPALYVRQGGHCQQFARSCVGAQGWADSAIDAWHAIPAAHRHAGYPRAGGIAYFDRAKVPDSREFGHAAFIRENGHVDTTDAPIHGRIGHVPYTYFAAHWGMRYLGWIDWTPSGLIRLATPGVVKPPALAYRQGKKVFSSKMRLGQANSDSVWNLVLALKAHGYPLLPVGDDYTSQVRNACGAYQRRQGWAGSDANGIAGRETVTRLGLLWVQG